MLSRELQWNRIVTFLLFCGYSITTSHIPNLSSLASPLYALNEQNLVWGKLQEQAFVACKTAFLPCHALCPFDPSRPLILAADASPRGTGAVRYLIDENGQERPVFFTSKTLNSAQLKYPHLEKEALAIIHALTKFHKYLWGRKFTLYCDNKPIVSILSERKPIPVLARQRLQRWAIILSAYDYELKYRKGTEMLLPDYLSRHPTDNPDKNSESLWYLEAQTLPYLPLCITDIAHETEQDTILSKVLVKVLCGWESQCLEDNLKPYWNKRDELSIEQGCLMWGERVIIPSSLKSHVLKLLHETHPGQTRMKLLVRSLLWWPNVDADIVQHVQKCELCQSVANLKTPDLKPWPCSSRRMQRIHIDFANFNKNNYLIIVDSYSHWLEVIHMKNTSFQKVKQKLLSFFATHGICEALVCDNGPPFNSKEFVLFCKNLNIKLMFSPPYHPASNGLAERGVQTFKKFIKKEHNGFK